MIMKQYMKLMMVVAVVILAAVGTYVLTHKSSSVPDIPTLSSRGSDVSSEFLNAQKSVDHYRHEIQLHPEKIKNYVELAQLFLQEGRVTGRNDEYVPKAKYLIEEALRRDPDNYDAMVTKATMLATLHQFAGAREAVKKAINKQPHSAAAYGILCDAEVELGNYPDAIAACDKMSSLRPDLRSYARISYLRELHGDIDGAIEAMKMAAEAGVGGQENREWVLYNLGKLFLNEGKVDTAAFIFNGILEERPNYPHALHGLALVNAQRGKVEAAIEFHQKAIAALNEPAFFESLGEVYQVVNKSDEAQRSYDRAEELYAAEKKNGEDNDMEMARFLAEHDRRLPDALVLARSAVERRPSISSYETLALALHKNGMDKEAQETIRRAMKLGTHDASMYYLAGAIANTLGDRQDAQKFSKMALSINRNFSLIHTRDAERMAGEDVSIGYLGSQ
jgi:tetratricopeptide (TPR) repeat protein